ncbi:MAG: PhnD/SsuA/transferrin family substrate-binding protein [Rhodospirillales bacterium]
MAGAISLPMYDFPASAAANDALVEALAARLPEAAPRRRRESDLARLWRAPDLLLSQTCGYPFMTAFRQDLTYVATPHYALPGCLGPRYCSFFLVRDADPAESLADLRGRRVAFNGKGSQSGYNCLRLAVAPLAAGAPFFAERLETGAHLASVAAVAEGRADLAAVDCVTHGLLARDRPEALAGTRILAESASAPGLPLVTRATAAPATLAALRRALAEVVADPDLAGLRGALALSGFTVLDREAYEEVLAMQAAAEALDYPELL